MAESSALLAELSEEAVWRLEETCCRFEQAWQSGRRPRLEDFLDGAEGAERLAVLRELLRLDVHYRRQAGEAPSAQDYATRFANAAALLSEMFPGTSEGGASPAPSPNDTSPDAGRTGPYLGAMNSGQKDAPANEADPSGPGPSAGAPTASRFQVRRFHAAGALGEVFVAEDGELHREVALKEIKRGRAGHEESRARFVLEAEITGNLEHPGIVPVYGMGAYSDGRPYYAMRFIRGETLAAAIKRFHGQAPVRFDSLGFRQLLGRLVAVCQAIAYAHNRGVLHRDVKPDNIMLGKFGETLVVDWGLAKVVGRPDAAAAGPGEEGPLNPLGGGRAQATVGVAGTPAFMSPEQAAGKVEELGPATDVYSLGATLYVLLTNQPPFQGKVVEVVRQVERGEWLPPRKVNGSAPAALDAVCRKAMALRPQDRYASALALAEDVEEWLADEPVKAHAESAGARLRRWARKRPRRVTAAVALLLAAVIGLTVGTVLLERSNREARENLEMTKGQVEYLVGEVSDDVLLNEPGMQQLRQRILEKVLQHYTDFLKDRPGSPDVRQQMAAAERQLGEMWLETGRLEDARGIENQAVAQYESLLRDAPADRKLRLGLARAHHALAELQVQSGDLGEGEKEVDRGIELLERLKTEEPGNGDCRIELARGYDLRVTVAGQQGDIEAGLAENKRVLEALIEGISPDRFETAFPRFTGPTLYNLTTAGNGSSYLAGPAQSADRGVSFDLPWQYPLLLGKAWTKQGVLLSLSGRNAEAARALEQAIVILRLLVEGCPRSGLFRHGLAVALLHSGRVRVQLGLPASAEPALREALGLMQRLIQDDPFVVEYRSTRLLAAGYLGEALFRLGRTADAAGLLREVETEGEKVLGGPGLRGQYARLLLVLGCLEGESGDRDRGLELCQKSHEKLEQALRETPGDRSLRSDWLASREALARYRFLKGDLDGWIAEQQVILETRIDLVGQGAPSPRFSGDAAGSAAVLASLLLDAGRPDKALACVDAALPALEKAVRTEQEWVAAAVKEQQEPESLKPGGISSLRFLLRDMPIVPDRSLDRDQARLLACRGAALARLGRAGEAARAARQAVAVSAVLVYLDRPLLPAPPGPAGLWATLPALCRPRDPGPLYDLAGCLALASTLPGEPGGPDLAGQAVQVLRCCAVSGFDDIRRLRTDPALEPLRKRDDFQNLLRDLEANGPGRQDPLGNR